MELLWQLFRAPSKIKHNRRLQSPWRILLSNIQLGSISSRVRGNEPALIPPKAPNLQPTRSTKTIFKDAGRHSLYWRTIVVISRYWRVKAVSSLIVVFIIQHSLPNHWKSHFQGPKFSKLFPWEHAPRLPYIVFLP